MPLHHFAMAFHKKIQPNILELMPIKSSDVANCWIGIGLELVSETHLLEYLDILGTLPVGDGR